MAEVEFTHSWKLPAKGWFCFRLASAYFWFGHVPHCDNEDLDLGTLLASAFLREMPRLAMCDMSC
jgi:hypothetical protein